MLGAPSVGKSTFVHCALDLKKASTSPISSKKVSLEGRISLVRLLELGLDEVEITEEEEVRWPRKVGNQSMPDIDGVLAMYDVMNQNSIDALPEVLSESFETSQPSLEKQLWLQILDNVFDKERESFYKALMRKAYTSCLLYRGII